MQMVNKVQSLFESTPEELLDDPQTIADAIRASATGANKQFRTVVGKQGRNLVSLRRELPIEEYLQRMSALFR